MADLAKLTGLKGLRNIAGLPALRGLAPKKRGGRGIAQFTISPAVNGKSKWNLDVDGPLVIDQSQAGTLFTLTPDYDFTASFKMWGAGGSQKGFGRVGGGAGMVGGDITLTKGQAYTLLAGQGIMANAVNALQGGGSASTSGTLNTGGPGGGFSFIRRGASGTTYLAIAPGGGGCGWAGAGGAGGDFTGGLDGYGRTGAPGTDGGGKGATPTAGGAAGTGGGGGAGSAYQGGNSTGGGGGGGGRFGGGGAGASTSNPGNGGGGGGGVAYVDPQAVTNAYARAGGKNRPADMSVTPVSNFIEAARPGGDADPDNGGAGWGAVDTSVDPASVNTSAGVGGRIKLF